MASSSSSRLIPAREVFGWAAGGALLAVDALGVALLPVDFLWANLATLPLCLVAGGVQGCITKSTFLLPVVVAILAVCVLLWGPQSSPDAGAGEAYVYGVLLCVRDTLGMVAGGAAGWVLGERRRMGNRGGT